MLETRTYWPLVAIVMLGAPLAQAQLPGGGYSRSCSSPQMSANVLHAKCRTLSGSMVDTSLNLPCVGSIDNINGKLTCTGAPAPKPAAPTTATLTVTRMTGGMIMSPKFAEERMRAPVFHIYCGQTDFGNSPDNCSAILALGTRLDITNYPMKGHTFRGWTGACTGTSPICTVIVDSDKTLGATFK